MATTWKYLVEQVGVKNAAAPDYLVGSFDARGADGWELVALVPNDQSTFPSSTLMFTAIWKRPT